MSYQKAISHIKRIKEIIDMRLDIYVENIVGIMNKMIGRNIQPIDNDIFLDLLDKTVNISDDFNIYFDILNSILYFFDRGGLLYFNDYYDDISDNIKNIENIINSFEYDDNKVEYSRTTFKYIIDDIANIKGILNKLYFNFNSELNKHGLNTYMRVKSKEEIMEELEKNIEYNEEKKRRIRENYINGAKKSWESRRRNIALREKEKDNKEK